MTEESVLNISNDAKAVMRNSIMMVGLMAILITSAFYIGMDLRGMSSSQYLGPYKPLYYSIIAIVMISAGTALAFLHKRDLVAIMFMILGFKFMALTIGMTVFGLKSSGCVLYLIILIMGAMMLFTRNEQKYLCSSILILDGLVFTYYIWGFDLIILNEAIYVASAAIATYSIVCIALENPNIPGYRILTADENNISDDGSPVDFKFTGALLGYMLISISMLASFMHYVGLGNISMDICCVLEASCGMMLIPLGLIMMTAGRMRFTSALFMMLGAFMSTAVFMKDMVYISFFFSLLLGLICILRPDRRILVGIAIIIYGMSYLVSEAVGGGNATVSAILNIVPFLILMYVCLALCSDGRLKLY